MPKILSLFVVGCAALISGCSSQSTSEIAGPRLVTLNPNASINSWPLGVTHGQVAIENGCVVAASGVDPEASVTLIFPPSFKVVGEAAAGWAIVDGRGDVWGRVGESRAIGGGVIEHPEVVTRFVTVADRESCPGPYWIVKPNDPLDLIPRNQPTPPLPEPGQERGQVGA